MSQTYALNPRRSKRWLRRLVMAALAAAAYVGSYAALSWRGDYQASQSGRLRFRSGPAVTDVYHWQPALATWEPIRDVNGRDTSRGDLPGYFYSPLIRLERKYRHPSHYLFEEAAETAPVRG